MRIDCVRCVFVKNCACLPTVTSWRANVRHRFAILYRRVMKRMKSMSGVNGRCWFARARSRHRVPHVMHRVFRRGLPILRRHIRHQIHTLPIALRPSCRWNASRYASLIGSRLMLICRVCFAWMLIDSMGACLLIDLVA